MGKIILYHGTQNKIVTPVFGGGNDKHDYGRGFYLTEVLKLAKEWAVCVPNSENGWVHKYELDCTGLRILDFQEKDVLNWLAELMKHRDAADSKRYRMLAAKFIDKYGIDTSDYDVIKGWYCIKSERAYAQLHEIEEDMISVPYSEFNEQYNQRDIEARDNMRKLVDSEANKVTKVFSTLL